MPSDPTEKVKLSLVPEFGPIYAGHLHEESCAAALLGGVEHAGRVVAEHVFHALKALELRLQCRGLKTLNSF